LGFWPSVEDIYKKAKPTGFALLFFNRVFN
jgi:hypothetical protein